MERQLFALPEMPADGPVQDDRPPGGPHDGSLHDDFAQVSLAPSPMWRLDDHTRAVGRRGLAQARAALRQATKAAAQQAQAGGEPAETARRDAA